MGNKEVSIIMYANNDDDKTIFMPLADNDEITQRNFGEVKQEQVREITSESLFQKVSKQEYMFGPNSLMKYASEIFAIHYQVINHSIDFSVDKLKMILSDGLTKFTIRCQQDGIGDNLLKSAKYILCAFIDEAILATEYGQNIHWSQQSMLSSNFNESWGGETFFKIRLFCLDNISEYIEVFELIYICLCLGFKGQFSSKTNGKLMLDRLKRESYDVICQYRDLHDDASIAKHWQTDYEPKAPIKYKHTFSIFFGVILAILLVIYIGLSFFINQAEQPVLKDIDNTKNQLISSYESSPSVPPVSKDTVNE
ncbi:type IVB secretion system protein IcmH/DotU [Francisella salimarina]|uniref:type IVB secretion system protein IcmH/DotU n=2 Tax=Francisella TaxID=262 RepID=UPI0011B5B2F4|nr:type IVB secretion system protein IcmH/DotU [Francisella salimarina]